MFRGTRLRGLWLAALAVPAFVSSAEATVYSFPGIECVAYQSVINYPGGSIEATQSAQLHCSLLRPTPDTSNITSISIYVTDNSTTEGFTCVAHSCNSGSGCSSSTVGTTGTTQTGSFTLTLSSIAGVADGHARISCNVPGPSSGGLRSRIQSYVWND